jgi:hypothetical protein
MQQHQCLTGSTEVGRAFLRYSADSACATTSSPNATRTVDRLVGAW